MPAMETNAPPPSREGSALPPAPDPAASAAGAPINWTTPPGWKQLPGNAMRFASFLVNQNPPVQMTVVPLGPESGALLPNVNRWEGQLGLPASSAEKLDSVVTKSTVNGLAVARVDLSSPASAATQSRMLAAIVPARGRVWFFKLVGPVDVVGQQKANFDGFVSSLTPSGSGDGGLAAPAKPQAAPAAPSVSMKLSGFKAGADWVEIPNPKAPRMIGFSVGPDAAKADVVVTRFAEGQTGSFLDNLNRWRGQLGLDPVTDARSVDMADATVGSTHQAALITIENPASTPPKKMIVSLAVVGPDMWFIKLSGPTETVEKAKPAFEAFMKSLEFAPEGNSDEKP